MLLLIDNYDSFTYNLAHYLRELGEEVLVVLNDKISLEKISDLKPSHIIISPGPGRPEQAGITIAVIQHFKAKIPMLGVCLGHQAIAAAFGGNIIVAQEIMHGKTSLIKHNNDTIFKDVPQPFTAMRYHSLVIDPASIPSELQITAWTLANQDQKSEIMGIQHCQFPISGVQFHPESIATEHGHQLLKNFLEC